MEILQTIVKKTHDQPLLENINFQVLFQQIRQTDTRKTQKNGSLLTPANHRTFFLEKNKCSPFFDKELCQQEAAKISENQLEDGSFPYSMAMGHREYTKVLYQRELVEIRSDHQNFLFLHAFQK